MNWRRKLTEEEKRSILSTTTIQINRERTLTNYVASAPKVEEDNEEVAKPYIPTFLGEVPEQLEDETQKRRVYQKPVDLTDKNLFPALGGKRKAKCSTVVPDATPTPSTTPVANGSWLLMAKKGEEEARIREERERVEQEEQRKIREEEAKNRPPPPPRPVLYEEETEDDYYDEEEYYSSDSSDY